MSDYDIIKGNSSNLSHNFIEKQYSISRRNISGDRRFIYSLEELGNEILSNPIAEKAYSRITRQGVQVIIDHGFPPSTSTYGEYKPSTNMLTVYDQNNLNVKQATATIIHESVHVERRTRFNSNTRYEEYLAFRREFIYTEKRRPTLNERKELWQSINITPEYQLLDLGKNPFGGVR